ncbi:MFS transporter [Dyadobacter psychrophilus]|uniref:Predicted arabinose efflux permease, MFS family n=1 Tax=Dyadobacter psychrophilus TaxID=651661 RepID=A0A1T5FV71_9BACT|nr:MFS transporter [Dyadobacter psychrophilus]SKC00075.1 Predicted arabinose efflux permease, MFS family [Dyadobacter psychrophilus]
MNMEILELTNLEEKRTDSKWLAFGLCVVSYMLSGTVSTLMSVYLPVAIPELTGKAVSQAELGEIGAYVNAIFLYGWMVGGLLFGFVSDRIGRVKSLTLVIGLYGISTCLVTIVTDWYSLVALRFFAGMGIGGVLLITTVYISEIWQDKNKAVMLGILAVFFPVGIVTTGSLNLIFSDWRSAFTVGVIPVIIAVLVFFLLPESDKWRLTKTYTKKPEGLFFESNRANLLSGSLIFGSVLIGLWGIFSWLPTWVQTLLATGQDGQKERGLVMILLGIGGITGGIFSGMLVNKFGKKTTLMVTFGTCLVMCCILFLTNSTFSNIIYIETAVLAFCFGISQGALSSYIPELFPVSIRGTATGFCFNVGRFFTATAVFFIGSLVAVLGGFGNALLVFTIPFLVALIVTARSK